MGTDEIKRKRSIRPAFDETRDDDTVLESVAQRYRFLDRIRQRPILGWIYRFLVGLLGGSVVIIGLILVPAPGPGWLIVFSGLAILATEFAWAKRLLDFGRAKFAAWMGWINRKPLWLRCFIGLVSAAFLVSVLLAGAYLSGWRGFPFG